MSVAERIVKARNRAEINDAEFARRAGVTKSTISDWVNGHHEPTLASLRRIAKALKCDIGELLGVS